MGCVVGDVEGLEGCVVAEDGGEGYEGRGAEGCVGKVEGAEGCVYLQSR